MKSLTVLACVVLSLGVEASALGQQPGAASHVVDDQFSADYWFRIAKREAAVIPSDGVHGTASQASAYALIISKYFECGRDEDAKALARSSEVKAAFRGVLLVGPWILLGRVFDDGGDTWLTPARMDAVGDLIDLTIQPYRTGKMDVDKLETVEVMVAAAKGSMSDVTAHAEKIKSSFDRFQALLAAAIMMSRLGNPNDAMMLMSDASNLQQQVVDECEQNSRTNYPKRHPSYEKEIHEAVVRQRHTNTLFLGATNAKLGLYAVALKCLDAAKSARVKGEISDKFLVDDMEYQEGNLVGSIIDEQLRRGQLDDALSSEPMLDSKQRGKREKFVRMFSDAGRLTEAEGMIEKWELKDDEYRSPRTMALLAVAKGYRLKHDSASVNRLWAKAREGTVPLKGRDEVPKKGYSDGVRYQLLELARGLYSADLINEAEAVEAVVAARREAQEAQAPSKELTESNERIFGPAAEIFVGTLKPVPATGRTTDPELNVDHAAALARVGAWDKIKTLMELAKSASERCSTAASIARVVAKGGD